MYKKSRGLRNNNPGNIRHGDQWQGMRDTQTDPDFIQFDNSVYGIRALNRVLRSYSIKHGINTVQGVISRWAPDHENDTSSYALYVAGKVGVEVDEVISLEQHADAITTAIIKYENGLQPYDVATIEQGVILGWA